MPRIPTCITGISSSNPFRIRHSKLGLRNTPILNQLRPLRLRKRPRIKMILTSLEKMSLLLLLRNLSPRSKVSLQSQSPLPSPSLSLMSRSMRQNSTSTHLLKRSSPSKSMALFGTKSRSSLMWPMV